MNDVVQVGDVLICRADDGVVDVVDAVTRRMIGHFSSYNEAFDFAIQQHGAVWQEDPEGSNVPVLLIARV